ncbi:BCCT family transporter, partial [Cloacibacillus porcorum]
MNKIRPYAFFPPFILLIIVAVYSLVVGMQDETQTVKVMADLFNLALDKLGWLYAAAALFVCLLSFFFTFSKYGNI